MYQKYVTNPGFTHLTLPQYKKLLHLTPIQREIIIGTLLGDSTIVKSGSNNGAFNIKFDQSDIREDYVRHLYKMFENFVGTPPKYRYYKDGSDRRSIWFRTYRHTCLAFYRDLFYNKTSGKKEVPESIDKLLTPRVLAYWIMDDGSFVKGNQTLKIHTQGFSYSDQELLVKVLKSNFDFDVTIQKDKSYYNLYIGVYNKSKVLKIIEPFFDEIPLFYEKYHGIKLR